MEWADAPWTWLNLLAWPPGSCRGPWSQPGSPASLMTWTRLRAEAQAALLAKGWPAEPEDWDRQLRSLVGQQPEKFEEFVMAAHLAVRDPLRPGSNYLHRAFLTHLRSAHQRHSGPGVAGVHGEPGFVGIPGPGLVSGQVPGVPGAAATEWGPPPGAAPQPPGLGQELELPQAWSRLADELWPQLPGQGPLAEAALATGKCPEPGLRQLACAAVAEEYSEAVVEEEAKGPATSSPPAVVEAESMELASGEPLWPGLLSHPRAPPMHWSWLHADQRRDLEAARLAAEVSLETHGALGWSQVWPSLCVEQASHEDELDRLLNLEAGQSYLQNAAWVGAFEAVAFRGYRRLGHGYQQLVEKLFHDQWRAMHRQNPWGELQLSRMAIERNSACRKWAALLSGDDVMLPSGDEVTPQVLAAYDELGSVFRNEMLGREAFWFSWLFPGIDAAVEPLEPMLDPYALAFELRPGIWLLDTRSWPEGLKHGFCPATLADHLAWSPAGQGEAGALPAGCRASDTGGSGSLPYFRPALPWQ